MSANRLKEQLDRIGHSLTSRFGPLQTLYEQGPDGPWLYSPAPVERIDELERELGFALPPLLKAIYTRIGNGGGAMLLLSGCPALRQHQPVGVSWSPDILTLYLDYLVNHPLVWGEPWPSRRVPIFDDHGCSLVSSIDCGTPEGAVWLINEGRWELTHPTLVEYIEEPMTSPFPF